ncbi:12547_t:CDS:2 [Dentiscutata heterogama]|uniref:12547_t:CDS:1 n=1 Tax=Dentiscutata heterogama TaxID=1316150 RepID=A0ACA9Q4W1_9GLOM|nr:12547_t:CDS:2 [Dentiscutata heterogama]
MSLYWPDYTLGQFENSMSRLFDDFFKDLNIERQSNNSVTRSGRIPLDIHEGEKEFTVCAELPGVTKEQINLDVRENMLVISEGNAHIQERRYGSFSRAITLPRSAKTSDIAAKFEHGVLEVKIPKDENKESRKKIDIQ